jgi:hypothetical protein
LNVGTPRESTLLPGILSKRVNTIETWNVGTPRDPTWLPGILAQRVKHNSHVEHGHSQGIDFVTLISLQSM